MMRTILTIVLIDRFEHSIAAIQLDCRELYMIEKMDERIISCESKDFGTLLGQFRTDAKLSQQSLAGLMHKSPGTIGNWERGDHLPRSRAMVLELAKYLCLDRLKRDQLLEAALFEPLGSLWTIPFKRNLLFTGREDILQCLHERLYADGTVALMQPQALRGLGGIGKTQTAIEYAYRHRDEYRVVLWIPANSSSTLATSILSMAQILNLPQKQESDSMLNAVRQWLGNHSDWLLILDDVEDLKQVELFYPEAHQGHVLVTTRSLFVGGIASGITMNKMEPDEGALFLLRRAGMLGPTEEYQRATAADSEKAKEISLTLGGLPLALDQAGAYMEETGCGLSGYLTLYQTQRSRLLKERGSLGTDHPESVTITFSLAFQKVAHANATARELLQFCAFLSPDAIPEELLTAGRNHLGPVLESMVTDPFQLNAALRTLLAYSLVQREANCQLFYVHQLVQAVLKDLMSKQEQQTWAERAVRAVSVAFPEVDAKEGWQQSTRILPHAVVCLALQEQWNMTFSEAIHLLSQTGNALWARSQYHQAEIYYKRALNLQKALLGPVHPDIAQSLMFLANVSADQGNYQQVDFLYQQALDVYEQMEGETQLDTARVLNTWAECYRERAVTSSDPMHYERADALYQRAFDLLRQIKDAPPIPYAATVSNRVAMQLARGHLDAAESQLLEAISIFEQHLGFHHLYTAVIIGNLGALYIALHRFDEAESLLGRARAILEEVGENNHPRAAQILCNLADLRIIQGKYEQAEPLYQEAIAIYESVGATAHPHVELFLRNYAILLWRMKRFAEAHTSLTRAESLLIAREGKHRSDEQIGKPQLAKQEQGAAFLLSCCELKDQAKAPLKDLWTVYEDWRKRHDRPTLLHSPRELVPFLKARQCSRKRSNEDRWWQGIAIRDEYYEITLGREQSDTWRF